MNHLQGLFTGALINLPDVPPVEPTETFTETMPQATGKLRFTELANPPIAPIKPARRVEYCAVRRLSLSVTNGLFD